VRATSRLHGGVRRSRAAGEHSGARGVKGPAPAVSGLTNKKLHIYQTFFGAIRL
jgi:hypothetical protein